MGYVNTASASSAVANAASTFIHESERILSSSSASQETIRTLSEFSSAIEVMARSIASAIDQIN